MTEVAYWFSKIKLNKHGVIQIVKIPILMSYQYCTIIHGTANTKL